MPRSRFCTRRDRPPSTRCAECPRPRSSTWCAPTAPTGCATEGGIPVWRGRRRHRLAGGRAPRILVLVENLSVPFGRRVWQESRALAEAGCEVHVICPRGTRQDTEPYAEIDGVHIHRYPLRA